MTPLLAAAILAQVQVRDEPKDWRLTRTANFNVYYPADGLLPRARQFAGWFEDARADLARRTGVEPRRVNVFLYRSFHDLLQSSYLSDDVVPLSTRIRQPASRPRRAAPCRPHARSRALAFAEPARDRIFIHCQASDRWNAWFIRHELAHHFQFEHLFAFRLPSWLIAVKDSLTAWWWIEGGADYYAGIFDSSKDQFVRDLGNERLYDLKELFYPDTLNPYDFVAPYYQGSYFWRFMEEKYGADGARRLFEAQDEGLPIPMQRVLELAVGKGREELELEFARSLQARWAPMMEGRTRPAERLTDTRQYYRRRAWGGRYSPDGKRLAWVGNADVWPELYVDGDGALGWRRGIFIGWVVSPPSWSPDGKRIAVIEWTTNKDVLLLVDVDGGTESLKFPELDELYDPAWAPDGTKIAFSALKNGTGDLYVVHLADRRVERLTDDADADDHPAWAPDGRLAWVKETQGRTVLYVDGKPVTRSWALLEHPEWSPDGKSVVLAADVGGVYDAFAVDPATGKAKRLTKFRGGVSYPAYHPDGSLVVTYYEGRGEDLYRVRPVPQDEPAFDQEDRKPWYEQFKHPDPRGEPADKTRVWGVDWLMFPITSQSLVTPGLEFVFGDRDGENRLVLQGMALGTRSWSASATVANTRWRPTLGVTAGVSQEGDLRQESVQPFVDVPLWTTLTTGVGWVARHRREFEDDADDPEFRDGGPIASFAYSNQMRYQLRDPAWGFAFGGSAAYFSEDLGGERELREYFGFAEASTDLAQDWIVWTRVTYEKLVTRELLESELLDLDVAVRGAEDLEGTDRGVATLELRFPLWRDFLWKPLELIGLGEWVILKDLRGFVFGQVGFAGGEFGHARDDDFGAASAGIGLRVDFSWMVWPVTNLRVPTRAEVWWAIVGQDEKDPRGAVGFGFVLGF